MQEKYDQGPCDDLCQKKKILAKSKTQKGGLSQKWPSRWIENPKGRSRQKLGAYKKKIFPVDWKLERAVQAKVRDFQKNEKWKMEKTEASHFQWAKQKNTPCADLWWLLPVWLIDGFYPEKWQLLPVWLIAGFYPEKWWLLHVVGLMVSPTRGLIYGDFCLWFD